MATHRRPAHPTMASWYINYLGSTAWAKRRVELLDARTRKCQDCGSRHKPTVHHLTYARIGSERDTDLRILCPRHHRYAHRWHDIPYLFLIYREDYAREVEPILKKVRREPDFEYPRKREKKGTGGVG